MRRFPVWWLAILCVSSRFGFAASIEPAGFTPRASVKQALVGATVVVKPGLILTNATIVVSEGRIETVLAGTNAPAGARLHDYRRYVVYPGFLELMLGATDSNRVIRTGSADVSSAKVDLSASGGNRFYGVKGSENQEGGASVRHPTPGVNPEYRVVSEGRPAEPVRKAMRELGFTAGNLLPQRGIFRGQSSLFLLGERDGTESVLIPSVFQSFTLDPDFQGKGIYPSSLMGVYALARQTLLDASYLKSVSNTVSLTKHEPWLEALKPVLSRQQRILLEGGSHLLNCRLAKVMGEFGVDSLMVASGGEWRRPDLLRGVRVPYVVPLSFPEMVRFTEEADWDDVSLDRLRNWDWAPEVPALIRKEGMDVALSSFGLSDRKRFLPNLRLVVARGLSETDTLAGLTTIPARLMGVDHLLGSIENGKLANLTVMDRGGLADDASRIVGVWVAGESFVEVGTGAGATNQVQVKPDLRQRRVARLPREEEGGANKVSASNTFILRGATIWTSGKPGVIEKGEMSVVNGRIKAIGVKLPAESVGGGKVEVVDATGMHVTPGLIDAHSHAMILGQVNEATLPSTAMVRVEDVVNSESANIRWQLAGGVTVVNLLHGSANPIGGQNAIIKLRDGATPDALMLSGAPSGIKFALGENVKQSNWGDSVTNRFPQTRMGVRTFLANRFTAAKIYIEEKKRSEGRPFRQDLELEAIAQILEGSRWIHCHSYRQDEILMFLRLMEDFGVKVGTLQHVLEGYKVADEIARHGAGASAFSDWWGFKFEVLDAIPFNGSLLKERGVVVSFNSDSADHARRLNTEAAKAVKYGDMAEEEALKLVTINPAIQLRIDGKVGSLEAGKDADFVLWSGSPLDSKSRCLQTWIEGRKYFDIADEAGRLLKLVQEREGLLASARKAVAEGKASSADSVEGRKFLEASREHEYDGCDRHCLDENHHH